MAIDKADWHYGGDFPDDLPDENGATHIGMYLAWIINNRLEGDIHHEDENTENALEQVRNRLITGRDFFLENCDEKFWDDDLNGEGLAFTHHYYSLETENLFYIDYEKTLAKNLPTIYHVENNWSNYDKIEKIINQRFNDWKSNRKK